MSDLINKIRAKVTDIAAQRSQELVDVEMNVTGSGRALKIIIGSQSGPTVADLSAINKSFREACSLDANLKVVDEFSVEVCSPGLDRPLSTQADYRRNLNRFIRVQYKQNEKTVITEFLLKEFSETQLIGELDSGEAFSIAIADLKKVQPAIRF